MVALAKMVEWYERKFLPKGSVRTSDWERDPLDAEQIECSSDVFLVIRFIPDLAVPQMLQTMLIVLYECTGRSVELPEKTERPSSSPNILRICKRSMRPGD